MTRYLHLLEFAYRNGHLAIIAIVVRTKLSPERKYRNSRIQFRLLYHLFYNLQMGVMVLPVLQKNQSSQQKYGVARSSNLASLRQLKTDAVSYLF